MKESIMENSSHQLVTGISFGITSGVITSLGMIVGMFSATNSKLAVIASIITMAIADGLSDGAGQHMSEESEVENGKPVHTHKEVWMTTLFTFLSVCGSSLTFVPFFSALPFEHSHPTWNLLGTRTINRFQLSAGKGKEGKCIPHYCRAYRPGGIRDRRFLFRGLADR